jgi:hypothetical protein
MPKAEKQRPQKQRKPDFPVKKKQKNIFVCFDGLKYYLRLQGKSLAVFFYPKQNSIVKIQWQISSTDH